ncbi:hypothetical protein MKW98_014637 [Papaver atlanticum]|uniref:Uncharacterized protein n=1 Tax=Papaver atlanticum TaxID=357466 RepID=A0AAD4XCT3_9MAGN|nr:hypothetical protein MKW98_014637 [Papaver atlanticum]
MIDVSATKTKSPGKPTIETYVVMYIGVQPSTIDVLLPIEAIWVSIKLILMLTVVRKSESKICFTKKVKKNSVALDIVDFGGEGDDKPEKLGALLASANNRVATRPYSLGIRKQFGSSSGIWWCWLYFWCGSKLLLEFPWKKREQDKKLLLRRKQMALLNKEGNRQIYNMQR